MNDEWQMFYFEEACVAMKVYMRVKWLRNIIIKLIELQWTMSREI